MALTRHADRTEARSRPGATAGRSQDPVDTLCDYLADDRGATGVLVTSISEDDIRPR